MKILQIPAFTDNYFWLLHVYENDRRAVIIDPGDFFFFFFCVPVIKKLNDHSFRINRYIDYASS